MQESGFINLQPRIVVSKTSQS